MDDDPLISIIEQHEASINQEVAVDLARFYSEHGIPRTAAELLPHVAVGVLAWTNFLAHTGSGVDNATFSAMVVAGERMGLTDEDIIESIERMLTTIVTYACTQFGPGGSSTNAERRLHSAIAIARMRVAGVILERAIHSGH